MILTVETRNARIKTCPTMTVHYKYYIDWPSLKPDICGERSASNLLSLGTALGMIK
jgi:hypothetical protein